MAGRRPQEALANFTSPLQRALSCITKSIVVHRPPSTGVLALGTSTEPIRLRRTCGVDFFLYVEQQYQLARPDTSRKGPWRAHTSSYRYSIESASGTELALWHWHPRTTRVSFPHLHVPPLKELGKHHLPSGRVSLESVIRLLITELDVQHCRDDWSDVLDRGETAFKERRSWS